jgi:hypothetical protein
MEKDELLERYEAGAQPLADGMNRELEERWHEVAARIRAAQGWSLRPVARLGPPRADCCTWLAAGDPGEVVVKLSANPFAPERSSWAVEALSLLHARGVPVPEVRWPGRLDEHWFVVVQERLAGDGGRAPRRRRRRRRGGFEPSWSPHAATDYR